MLYQHRQTGALLGRGGIETQESSRPVSKEVLVKLEENKQGLGAFTGDTVLQGVKEGSTKF